MLRAGRTEPAAEVYAQVKTDTPDDVWLYNSAGLEYAAAGDPQQARDSTDYRDYTHRLERHLHNTTTAGPAALWITPIQIDAFQRWCHSTGHDPATASARAGYAAERARIAAPELINWPPARNAPCW